MAGRDPIFWVRHGTWEVDGRKKKGNSGFGICRGHVCRKE